MTSSRSSWHVLQYHSYVPRSQGMASFARTEIAPTGLNHKTQWLFLSVSFIDSLRNPTNIRCVSPRNQTSFKWQRSLQSARDRYFGLFNCNTWTYILKKHQFHIGDVFRCSCATACCSTPSDAGFRLLSIFKTNLVNWLKSCFFIFVYVYLAAMC